MGNAGLLPEQRGRDSWGLGTVARLVVAAMLACLLAVAVMPSPRARASGVEVTPGARIWFAETGQVAEGPFLAYWFTYRDTQQLGYPITPAMQWGDHLVQWFENARLEAAIDALGDVTPERVIRSPIGRSVSEKSGYTMRHEAFLSVAGAGEHARFFPDTGHTLQHGFRIDYEKPGVPEQLGPPISEEFSINGVVYQYYEYGAMSWSPEAGVERVKLGVMDAALHNALAAPQARPEGVVAWSWFQEDLMTAASILAGERWIDIDLSEYTISAYIGQMKFLSAYVVTGSPNSPTVKGSHRIWLMNRYQTLDGIGWDGQPYYEADVPWVMYFYEDYAIHGTTWRTEFGYADSQGCAIPPNEIAEQLYEFAYIGMRVEVHQ